MEIEKCIPLSTNYILNLDFFESIKEVVTCSICIGVLIDPITCNKCETSYCMKCLNIWKNQCKGSLACPMKCHNNKFNAPSRVLKNILEKLEFRCKFGCLDKDKKDNFNYSAILNHLYNECELLTVNCNLCSSKVKYKDIKKSDFYKFVSKLQEENLELKSKNTGLILSISDLNKEIEGLKIEIENNKKNNFLKNFESNFSNDVIDKCSHFKGNYIPIFDCCKKSYSCYLCHNEAVNHPIQISNKVICLYCKEIYTGNQCSGCGVFQLYKKKI